MGIKWIILDKVDSTNSYLAALNRQKGTNTEVAVVSDYQDNGRGQGDHLWHSVPGENLLMSLLLFPAFLSASDQFQLSRIVSLSICEILKSFGVDSRIKWPNDILTERGKIAGILIEHGISGGNISHSIIGIGLNLNQRSFPPFPVPATSLVLESGIDSIPGVVAKKLWTEISCWYKQLEDGDSSSLERAYLEKMHWMNEQVNCSINGKDHPGIVRGVNNYGELLVELEGEVKAYGHQEILVT